MESVFVQMILNLLAAHPEFAIVFTVVSLSRALLKPLFAAWHAYVEWTVSKDDDKQLAEIENSKFMAGVWFVLDWLLSIKPPPKVVPADGKSE